MCPRKDEIILPDVRGFVPTKRQWVRTGLVCLMLICHRVRPEKLEYDPISLFLIAPWCAACDCIERLNPIENPHEALYADADDQLLAV